MITDRSTDTGVPVTPWRHDADWSASPLTADRAATSFVGAVSGTPNAPMSDLRQFYVTDLGISTKAQDPPRGAPR